MWPFRKARSKSRSKSRVFKVIATLLGLSGLMYLGAASADVSGLGLSTITTHVNTTVSYLAKIFVDIALVAGVGFIMAAFFKFHQHKLNPTQVPISQGVTLLLIGAGLTLFTTMLPTAKKAVFGSAEMAKVGGSQLKNMIGTVS